MDDKRSTNDLSVAVIGGGIAGLSAAYELDKAGAEIDLYEKDLILGGRAPHANQIVTPSYEKFLDLMGALGIKDELLKDVSFDEMGAYMDGDIHSFEGFAPFLKPEEDLSFAEKYLKRPLMSRLMGINVDQVKDLKKDIRDIRFDRENPDDKAQELAEISAREWMDSYPENVRENILYPVMRTLFVNDLSKISAESAAHHLKDFYEAMSDTLKTVSGGPTEIAGTITEEIDVEVNISTKVVNVEDKGENVLLETEEVSTKYDRVIVATTLDAAGEILDTDFGLDYNLVEAITVDGELKGDYINIIGASTESNLKALLAPSKEHLVFPEEIGEDPEFDDLYERYTILGREDIISSPLIPPGYDLPDLQHSENVYLAGDFYRYSGMETAVHTGRKVGRESVEK